jgi:hypothetical protein
MYVIYKRHDSCMSVIIMIITIDLATDPVTVLSSTLRASLSASPAENKPNCSCYCHKVCPQANHCIVTVTIASGVEEEIYVQQEEEEEIYVEHAKHAKGESVWVDLNPHV